MRKAQVFYKDELAGELTQHDDGTFTFGYIDAWVQNVQKPSISLTLPKSKQVFHADHLFPFFYNMLPEGTNRQVVSKHHRIDADDYFGLLMITAKSDSIGAVNVIKSDKT